MAGIWSLTMMNPKRLDGACIDNSNESQKPRDNLPKKKRGYRGNGARVDQNPNMSTKNSTKLPVKISAPPVQDAVPPRQSTLRPIDTRYNLLIGSEIVRDFCVDTYQGSTYKNIVNYTIDMRHESEKSAYRFKLCMDDLATLHATGQCKTISITNGEQCEFNVQTDSAGNTTCQWIQGSRPPIVRLFKSHLFIDVSRCALSCIDMA